MLQDGDCPCDGTIRAVVAHQLGQCSRRAVASVNVNLLKPKTYFIYSQFNIQQFYVLPTQFIYVFCVDLRTNSDYFSLQY